MLARVLLVVVVAMAPASAEPRLSSRPPIAASIQELIESSRRQTAEPQLARRFCCKRCTKGIPCGNSCIAAWKRCRVGPGCAC